MYALPGQDIAGAVRDVEEALALAPAHVSHYQLTLEPGTVFAAQPPPLPDEDLAAGMLEECAARLAAAGFEHYEVSAYARPAAQCRHNLNYWSFGDYLGIGAGAHGKLTCPQSGQIVRTTQPREPRRYLAAADGDLARRVIPSERAAVRIHAERAAPDGGLCTAHRSRRAPGSPGRSLPGRCAQRSSAGCSSAAASTTAPSARGLQFLNELLLGFLPETPKKTGACALSMATPEPVAEPLTDPLFTARGGLIGE